MSERASEMAAILATIDPTTAAATSTGTNFNVIDASAYDSILFIVQSGAACCSGAATLTVYNGTATATVTTKIGSTTANLQSDKQLVFDLDCEDLDGPNYRYVKGTFKTPSTGVMGYSGIALGFKPRYHPASDDDLASVVAIKQST